MKNMPSPRIAGPLSPGSPLYIQREADEEVVQYIRLGENVQLSEPRDQGKTSLIHQLRARLDSPTCKVAYVYVTTLKATSEADWYRDLRERLLAEVSDLLDIRGPSLVPTDASSWRTFLQHLMTARAKHAAATPLKLIVALDEVENIPSAWSTSFFQVLREIYTSRFAKTYFQRLSFILSGTFEPLDIAQRVNLKDFDYEQVSRIARDLSLAGEVTIGRDEIARSLFYWAGGHPYLTRWLGRYLEYVAENVGVVTLNSIETGVEELLQETNDHLLGLRQALRRESKLLDYLKLVTSRPIPFAPAPDLNPEQFRLVHLYGLLKANGEGNCEIRNRIYEAWFEIGATWQEWEQRITTHLRTEGRITQETSSIPGFAWSKVISHYKQHHTTELHTEETQTGTFRLKRGMAEVSELNHALEAASQELRKNQRLDPAGSLHRFTQLLQKTVGLNCTGQWRSRGMLQSTIVEIISPIFRNLNNMPKAAPLFFIPAADISDDIAITLASLAGELRTAQHFSFVVPLSRSEQEEAADAERLLSILVSSRSPYDYVLLSRDALLTIFTARDPHEALMRHVAGQVSPSTVSPFIVQGAVTVSTGMFYGREKEVSRVITGLESRSFVIVGNRRIGKSSLLSQIRQFLEDKPQYYIKSFDYQGHKVRSPQELREDFATMQREANGRKIIQIIDEIDEILIEDEKQRYRCSAVWRELSETRRCRFVFAGHRVLRRVLLDARSPFFNFAETIHLGFLDERHARDLLADPLRRIGFQLEMQKETLDRVWQISSGHPNIIQVIGKGLLDQLERGQMSLTMAHLDKLLTSRRFQDEYEGAMWGGQRPSNEFGVSPLERIILLLGNPGGFTRAEIEKLLHQNRVTARPQEIYDALGLLVDFDLLNNEGARYTCNVRLFLRTIANLYGRKYLLDTYKEELQG